MLWEKEANAKRFHDQQEDLSGQRELAILKGYTN
jgi:hypothetical protein